MGWTVIHFWGENIKKNINECIKCIEEIILETKYCDIDRDFELL